MVIQLEFHVSMINLINILSIRSSKWNSLRKQHLIKQPSCQACGSSKKLQVHHIDPVQNNPEKELDPTNLVTLCSSCHFVFGHLMDYKSWNINVIDDIKVYNIKIQNRPYNIKTAVQKYENNTIYRIIGYYIKYFFCWHNRS